MEQNYADHGKTNIYIRTYIPSRSLIINTSDESLLLLYYLQSIAHTTTRHTQGNAIQLNQLSWVVLTNEDS